MLRGREIVVEGVTRDPLVVRVTRFVAGISLLDKELAQVFLVSGTVWLTLSAVVLHNL